MPVHKMFIGIDTLSYLVQFPSGRGAYVCDEFVSFGEWHADLLYLDDTRVVTKKGRVIGSATYVGETPTVATRWLDVPMM